jgi:RNA polymerase sigma-54 factor
LLIAKAEIMPTQSLSLNQSQRMQMVLAPQLRQSLEMLQVPILELHTMIQKEMEQNPTLEELAPEGPVLEIEQNPGEKDDTSEMAFDKEFEVLAKLDDEWRDYFFQDIDNRPGSSEAQEKHQFLMDSLPQRESLQEHLMKQLTMTDLSAVDQQIGEMIIGSINDDGYLTASVKEMVDTTPFDSEHIENVLLTIQDFHPVGVGATDLRDCLLLQLERLGKADSLAGDIVRDHLELLAAHKTDKLAKALKVSSDEVKAAAAFIATLDPTPGQAFSETTSAYVIPEVVVRKMEGKYVVILNDDRLPHLRISRHYRELMENENTTREVKTYIRDKLRSSAFLLKSIDQRQRTIYKIASEIVNQQSDFLEHGVSHLRPLTMAAVADAVGVHETTVSRAVNQKYMRTPIGTFEMKYFFNPGLKTSSGNDISNKTVKDIIKAIVDDEDIQAPLSDIAIMGILKDRGIKVARRTVAKYRDMMKIPPSHLRKRD